jgi:hypothetical protein
MRRESSNGRCPTGHTVPASADPRAASPGSTGARAVREHGHPPRPHQAVCRPSAAETSSWVQCPRQRCPTVPRLRSLAHASISGRSQSRGRRGPSSASRPRPATTARFVAGATSISDRAASCSSASSAACIAPDAIGSGPSRWRGPARGPATLGTSKTSSDSGQAILHAAECFR